MDHLKMDIRVDESSEWRPVFSRSLSGAFDLKLGPLWSVTLMPNAASEFYDDRFETHAALVFRFAHVIIDGLGRS